jgi:hypothetical protein
MMDLSKHQLIKIPRVLKAQNHPKYQYVVYSYMTKFGEDVFEMSSAFSLPEYYYLGDLNLSVKNMRSNRN